MAKRKRRATENEMARLQRSLRVSTREHQKRKTATRRKAQGGRTTTEERRAKRYLDDPHAKGSVKNRPFKKGNPGRPKGAKDLVPGGRTVRASVKSLIEEVVDGNAKSIRDALKRGIRSGSRHADRYLRLCAEYTDGKPVDTINLNSQYRPDELASAKASLSRKLDKMLAMILHRRSENSEAPE
jgi:hypothetical protein